MGLSDFFSEHNDNYQKRVQDQVCKTFGGANISLLTSPSSCTSS